jgi:hypothetical protein
LEILPTDFNGNIPVENRFHFTNLNKCSFSYKIVNFYKPEEWLPGYPDVNPQKVVPPDIKPGERGELRIALPSDWNNHDALILTAVDPYNNEIYKWTWQIKSNDKIIAGFISLKGENKAEAIDADTTISLRANGTSVTISKKSGKLSRAMYNNRTFIMFNNGPVLTGGNYKLTEIKSFAESDGAVAEAKYEGNLNYVRWKMYNSGWMSLDYQYELTGPCQFAGVSFSFPENYVTRAKWLGDGPSRVWKNRLRGMNYNVWSKVYNNTQTGAYPFFYPEFKGYFSNFTWLELSTAQGKILMAADDNGLFLRLYNFYGITGPKSYPGLPPGDISFLDCIPPLGSKLATGLTTDASVYGPEGKPTEMSGIKRHKLWFYFGVPDVSPQTP